MPPPTITDHELAAFRELLERDYGISLGPDKAYLFETRLGTLMVELGCSYFSELFRLVTSPDTPHVREQVIDAITTQETQWFRNLSLWKLLEEGLLPELARRAEAERRVLRAWSCACSTGQEPYSLAMLARENRRLFAGEGHAPQVDLLATDVSTGALTLARSGRYSRLSVHRGALGSRLGRYFVEQGPFFELDAGLRRMVRFERLNLRDDFSARGPFDLVLCRNVLIYFSPDFRSALVRRLREVLRPGGFLLLGATEGLYGDSAGFERQERGDVMYYRKVPG